METKEIQITALEAYTSPAARVITINPGAAILINSTEGFEEEEGAW